MEPVELLLLPGSLRGGSTNRAVLRTAAPTPTTPCATSSATSLDIVEAAVVRLPVSRRAVVAAEAIGIGRLSGSLRRTMLRPRVDHPVPVAPVGPRRALVHLPA